MAIAFVTSKIATGVASFAGPSATGSNLVYVIWADDNGGGLSQPTVTVGGSNATYTGNAVTGIFGASGNGWAFIFANPSGTPTITTIGGQNFNWSVGCYSGTTATLDGTASSTVTGNHTLSITTTIANDWLVGMANGNNTITAGAGATNRVGSGPGDWDSNGALSIGSNSMTLNCTVVNGMILVALRPFVASTVNSGFFFVIDG